MPLGRTEISYSFVLTCVEQNNGTVKYEIQVGVRLLVRCRENYQSKKAGEVGAMTCSGSNGNIITSPTTARRRGS